MLGCAVPLTVVLSTIGLIGLTVSFYHEYGSVVSISEILLSQPPWLHSIYSTVVIGTAVVLNAAFTTSTVPKTRMARVNVASFYGALWAMQTVFVVTYRDSLYLHFLAAAVFYASATTHIVLSYIANRRWIAGIALGLMICALVSMLAGCLSFYEYPRVDRRPPFVAGELTGAAAFLLHTLTISAVRASPTTLYRPHG